MLQDTKVKMFKLPEHVLDPLAKGPNDAVPAAAEIDAPDLETDACEGHVSSVNAVVQCGQYICSAGGDAMVRVWEADSLKLVRVLRGHRGSILCLLVMGNYLLSGARDNTIR